MPAFNLKPLIQRLDDMRHRPVGTVVSLLDEGLGSETGLTAALGVPQERDPEPQPPLISEVSLIGRLSEIGTPEATRVLVKLAALVDVAQKVIAAYDAENRTALENEHAAIRKQGRAVQEQVAQLRDQAMAAEIGAHDALAQADRARTALRDLTDAEREGRALSRWHTDAELVAWCDRVERARNRLGQANQAFAEAQSNHMRAQNELNAATTKLHELGAQETRLRNRLTGTPYHDAEYGLEVKP